MYRFNPIILIIVCWIVTPIYAADDNQVQLTFSECMKGYADFSPDGMHIVYTSLRDVKSSDQEGDLWVVSVDGGDPVKLTHSGGHHGVFSPDGRKVIYDADQGSVIKVISARGGLPASVVPESVEIEHSGNPCWSPDGTKIAVRSFEDLLVFDLESGESKSVFHKDQFKPMPIQWSKTDNCIVVAVVSPELRQGDLWKIFFDDREPQRLTFHQTYVSQGSLSPDEKYVIFASNEDRDGYDLYVVQFEGGPDSKLTDDPGHYVEPCWSPVEDRIVFTSTRSGGIELWLMDIDVRCFDFEVSF